MDHPPCRSLGVSPNIPGPWPLSLPRHRPTRLVPTFSSPVSFRTRSYPKEPEDLMSSGFESPQYYYYPYIFLTPPLHSSTPFCSTFVHFSLMSCRKVPLFPLTIYLFTCILFTSNYSKVVDLHYILVIELFLCSVSKEERENINNEGVFIMKIIICNQKTKTRNLLIFLTYTSENPWSEKMSCEMNTVNKYKDGSQHLVTKYTSIL